MLIYFYFLKTKKKDYRLPSKCSFKDFNILKEMYYSYNIIYFLRIISGWWRTLKYSGLSLVHPY